jgi:F-type H+-transporting ATPase subunit a
VGFTGLSWPFGWSSSWIRILYILASECTKTGDWQCGAGFTRAVIAFWIASTCVVPASELGSNPVTSGYCWTHIRSLSSGAQAEGGDVNSSPFAHENAFQIGPVIVTEVVVITWVIMVVMVIGSIVLTRDLKHRPNKKQTILEVTVSTIDQQIRDTMQTSPERYRALIGTIFLFILFANWTSLLPGVAPPTATLETDAALSLIVFAATLVHGIRTRGWSGYLKTFAEPSWVMIPVNVFEHFTRTFSMIIRLFGNIMSGVFVIGIVLSLAGLLVPIPLMALDLLTGTVQAYIFAVLAMVFIGAAIGEADSPAPEVKRTVSE